MLFRRLTRLQGFGCDRYGRRAGVFFAAGVHESPAISSSHLWHRFDAGSRERLAEEFKGGNLWDERKSLSKSHFSRGEPQRCAQRSVVQ